MRLGIGEVPLGATAGRLRRDSPPMPVLVRLAKFLAHGGVASRRPAEKRIVEPGG